MVLYEGRAVTFKHFYHFPSVAKSAGYDFNYFDCLSVGTQIPGNFMIGIINWFRNFLDLEIRQLPEYLFVLVAMILAIPFYFIAFPIIALVLYRKLKKTTYNYSRNHILMVLNHCETK
ncbi:hypothetical protein vBPmiSPMCJR_081 [Proteus phage vB_PmiS_PM-CJR]|nr:hypothetical protein vBPmiSPMCJR_081 [Proteus phage vB_PmiS_PM-CJR]